MAIKIFPDRIQIGNFNLFEGNGGIQFDGQARAENFVGRSPQQGSNYGYATGGFQWTNVALNSIDRFPFATDTNATLQSGVLTAGALASAAASSLTHAYVAGNIGGTPPGATNTMNKFPFANPNANATNFGNLSVARGILKGNGSKENGYASGGYTSPAGNYVSYNNIEKYPFATDSNATDIADLTAPKRAGSTQNSPTHAYYSAGYRHNPATSFNTIDRFPFATDANATTVAYLLAASGDATGNSSDVSGYSTSAPPDIGQIQKFPFATNLNATDVGDLNSAQRSTAGSSSTVSGYLAGGGAYGVNNIQKYPFATDTNATDVGDLTNIASPYPFVQARSNAMGHQF